MLHAVSRMRSPCTGSAPACKVRIPFAMTCNLREPSAKHAFGERAAALTQLPAQPCLQAQTSFCHDLQIVCAFRVVMNAAASLQQQRWLSCLLSGGAARTRLERRPSKRLPWK